MPSFDDNLQTLGKTLVNFSADGVFPDDEAVSAAPVESSALPAALVALQDTKEELEREIRQISRESAPDVDSWIENAKSLQDDIESSRRLASEIVQQAKLDERREETLQDKQLHLGFLSKEMAFQTQLLEALRSLQKINACLDEAESFVEERNILDALRKLEDAWRIIAQVPVDKHTRAIMLLDQRCFQLRDSAFVHLNFVLGRLVEVDVQHKTITVHQVLPSEPTNLDQALICLKAYKQLDNFAIKLWEDLDQLILRPRTKTQIGVLPSIAINQNVLSVDKKVVAEHSIKALLHDIEAVIQFLSDNLPHDILVPLRQAMMPKLSARIKEDWLDPAVPSSLDDMIAYQKALANVDGFAKKLQSIEWPTADIFHDWVSNSSKIWLAKRREDALDWVRNEMALGIGAPQFAERVESRMLEKEEGSHLVATNNIVTQDWDAAWDSGEEEEHTNNVENGTSMRNRHSIDEERRHCEVVAPTSPVDDDTADSWGWGEEDGEQSPTIETANTGPPLSQVPESNAHASGEVRQVTMSEKYWTSSMPQPVMRTLVRIFDDGARLIKPESEHIPVAPAAPGLLGLPTLILAMYRAIGPFYYSRDPSGNMFLYNDAIWLVGQLQDLVKSWQARADLPSRAYGMVQLDNEIDVMGSFGKRAYTNELNAQRTIINDLLGGTQNFFQDESSDHEELIQRATTVVEHIRSKAAAWKQILSPSAASSAIGSLVNTIALRLINDIFDMTSMSVAEAESAATVISLIEKLDDLFLPLPRNGYRTDQDNHSDQVPLTAQFADQWMKMKFLSQTLQSNLTDIHFLWFESELSYYFTASEVVELIELSFENNPQVRGEIRKIRENPYPMGEEVVR